jgi:predicted RNase H-like HicB family nuclease
MEGHFILTDLVEEALAWAAYDKLEDGTFSARIPLCIGVIAFGSTLKKCENELRSVLEDWILLGVKLGHSLPVIAGIDLNKEPQREPVDSV